MTDNQESGFVRVETLAAALAYMHRIGYCLPENWREQVTDDEIERRKNDARRVLGLPIPPD